MPSSSLRFFPLAQPFLLALALLFAIRIALIEVGIHAENGLLNGHAIGL